MTLPFKVTSRWIVCILTCLIVLLALYAVAGDRGAIHLWRLRGEQAKLDEQNFRLQKANEALRQRIAQVRNSNFYLEKLAREELNLVRPGEVIYRFPPAPARQPEKPREPDAEPLPPMKDK